jgi:multidrug resistance efflux pump
MSYAELAEARRISASSASRLVLRRGWRRQKDNHGIMRALVPPEWSEPAPGKVFEPGAHVSQAISALETAVAAMRERAEAAERVAQTERERADRAVQARDGERSRANALRDRIDALQATLAEAEAALGEALQQTAEAEVIAGALRQSAARWQSIGRLARLRWAWRGDGAGTEDDE